MPPALRARLFTLRILWFAISSSTVMLIVVLQMVASPGGSPPPLLAAAFGGVALSVAVISVAYPRFMYRSALRQATFPTTLRPGASQGASYRAVPETERVFVDASAAAGTAAALFHTPFILGLALTESIALFGFVLRFQGAPWPLVAPFFAVAWVLFALRFPAARSILGPLERIAGARAVFG